MNGSGLTATDASAITSGAITLQSNTSLTGGNVTIINDGQTLGTSNISSAANIAAKGNVLIQANTGNVSIAGITTDGSVTSGAAVSLLAMDDITNATRAIENSSVNGNVTLQAGRSITSSNHINSTNGGAITIRANNPYDISTGVSASRSTGTAVITISGDVGSANNTAFGPVDISIGNGANLANNTSGTLSLFSVQGRSINVTSNGTSGSGISLNRSMTAYGVYDNANSSTTTPGTTVVTANNGSITVMSGSSVNFRGSEGNTVVLKARDDITMSSSFVERQIINGTNPAGEMQLLAGRSVLFNSEFQAAGSPLTIKANYFDNSSSVSSTRLHGDAVITMGGSSGSIRNGANVSLEIMDGVGLSTTDASAITSGNITLREIPSVVNLTVTNNGLSPGSGVTVGSLGLGITSGGGTTTNRLGAISGLVNISTRNGDISLLGNIATSNTSAGAITLIAGTASSAPTSTGGDIILTGTRALTTGTGGSALLFAGSSGSSTGLSALATSARTFFNVDPANMPAGVTTGIYALFRQNTLPLTITLDNTTMVYGDSFPTMPTFTLTGGTFNTGDSISSIAWGTAATAFKAQGTYAYNTASLLAPTFACAVSGCAANYSLTFVNGLTITPRPITITADAKTMTYGGVAPALSYQITSGSIVNNDAVSGVLSRVAGIRAGTYAINQNTLSFGSNYAVNFTPASFTINPAVLTVSLTNTGVTKIYDGTNAAPAGFSPVLSVTGLVANDTAATLSNTGSAFNDAHVLAADKVTVSGLAITGITGSNGSLPSDYVLSAASTFVPATITPVSVTVSSASIGGTLSKTYDGTTTATGASVSGTVTGGIAGDVLNLGANGMSLTYSSPRAGSSTISASGTPSLVISSSSAGSLPSDYSFTAPVIADVAGTITPKILVSTLTNTKVSKPFDGTVSTPSSFEPQFAFSGLIEGDTFASLSGSASFNTADPQTANAVVVSSLAISQITGSNGSVPSDYRLDSTEKFVSAKIIQQPLSFPALVQSSTAATTATTATSSQTIESRKENVLIAARVAVSAVSTSPAPQIKLAAVLNFGEADVGMDLLVSPNSSSLTLAQSTTSESSSKEDAEVKTKTIDLFTQTGNTVAAGGALSIVEQGRSLSASNVSTSSSGPTDISLTGMRFVNVDYSLPSGGKNQLSVGVSSDGVLVVKVPPAMKAASDDRSLALIGMATAKARLDVQPANVKGVVIQVE
jgi:hypothetical protein